MVVRRRVIYFNPRSPHGERQTHSSPPAFRKTFQPTLPARGATIRNWRKPADSLFQPTLPARGATYTFSMFRPPAHISTHAPRTGSDVSFRAPACGCDISTHAPRTGSDAAFQGSAGQGLISTHAPRTGSDVPDGGVAVRRGAISTHAPRTGSDPMVVTAPHPARFQPTLPARGATATTRRERSEIWYFNPRSPHGERRQRRHVYGRESAFQPTLPARGATANGWTHAGYFKISTHAPRTGSDGEVSDLGIVHVISTHAPRTGSDAMLGNMCRESTLFQPTLPARGATYRGQRTKQSK